MARDYHNSIGKFSALHAVVVGEAMLDRYSTGQGKRLCAEAPVPIVDNCSTLNFAGAAANTAINLRTLGSRVTLVSVIGNDPEAAALSEILAQHGIELEHLQRADSRQTLSKHRVLVGEHMLARFDHGTTAPLERNIERKLIQSMEHLIPYADLVVISDYNYGVVTPRLVERLSARPHMSSKCLAVDSRRLAELSVLSPTVVKPNYSEALQLLGVAAVARDRGKQMLHLADDVRQKSGARIAAITLDQDGAVVAERGRGPYRTTADPVPHNQTAGAGDTYLAAFALALAAGASTVAAAEIAAAAAAIVVAKRHTASCSADELFAAIFAKESPSDLAGLAIQMDRHRRAGRRIVLTSGCFDILHRGHVAYLERARTLGDVLVVGVNSDSSIRKLKGPDRPINCLEDRLGVLAGLSCVDHLVSFDETTPDCLIEAIRPDVFVKGGDYSRDTLPEATLVEALGGRVVILPYLCDHSTTGIVQRIWQLQGERSNGRNGKHRHAQQQLGRSPKHPLRPA